jgi:hypothetical protein
MGKIIEDWLSKPLYIYIFGLFFLIYKSAQYFASFDPSLFICFFGGYCLINYSVIWMQKKVGLYKYGSYWLIFTWILLLFLNQITIYLNEYLDKSFVRFRYFFLFTILLCVVIYLIGNKISKKNTQALNAIINVFLLILIGSNVVLGLELIYKENAHTVALNRKKHTSLKIKNNKDLIWILLDEYTDPASLRSQFKTRNSLVDSLKIRGFFVFDKLQSRSDATAYSLNSLFNLDDSIPISNYSYAVHHLNESIWVDSLRRNGYKFINFDFLKIGNSPKFTYLRIFPDNYIDQIISGSMFAILLEKFSESKMPFDSFNQKIVRAFKLKVRGKQSKPVFIWTHLLIPHEPFYRDANGNINKSPVFDLKASPPSIISSQYIGYLNYGNKIVLEMLNEIPDWKNKIIVISGDHGARMLVPDNDPRRKQPFGAIYYPGMDQKELSKIKYMQQIPFHLH